VAAEQRECSGDVGRAQRVPATATAAVPLPACGCAPSSCSLNSPESLAALICYVQRLLQLLNCFWVRFCWPASKRQNRESEIENVCWQWTAACDGGAACVSTGHVIYDAVRYVLFSWHPHVPRISFHSGRAERKVLSTVNIHGNKWQMYTIFRGNFF